MFLILPSMIILACLSCPMLLHLSSSSWSWAVLSRCWVIWCWISMIKLRMGQSDWAVLLKFGTFGFPGVYWLELGGFHSWLRFGFISFPLCLSSLSVEWLMVFWLYVSCIVVFLTALPMYQVCITWSTCSVGNGRWKRGAWFGLNIRCLKCIYVVWRVLSANLCSMEDAVANPCPSSRADSAVVDPPSIVPGGVDDNENYVDHEGDWYLLDILPSRIIVVCLRLQVYFMVLCNRHKKYSVHAVPNAANVFRLALWRLITLDEQRELFTCIHVYLASIPTSKHSRVVSVACASACHAYCSTVIGSI